MKTNILAPFLKSINLFQEEDLPSNYPFNIKLFKDKKFSLEFKKPITFFVGENGSGKSTILEAIAVNCGFNISGGGNDHFYKSSNTEDFAAINALNQKLRFGWLPKIEIKLSHTFPQLRSPDHSFFRHDLQRVSHLPGIPTCDYNAPMITYLSSS